MHSEDIISAAVLALVCAVLVDICRKAIIQYRNKKQTRKYCLDAPRETQDDEVRTARSSVKSAAPDLWKYILAWYGISKDKKQIAYVNEYSKYNIKQHYKYNQKLIKFKTYDRTANNKAIQIALKGNASHKDMVELSDAIMKNSSHLSEIILSSYNKIT